MDLNWIESLFYGLISGIAEFLPVSADAHRALFMKLSGSADGDLPRLMVHIGALLALLISSAPALARLARERKIAAAPKGRRKRQPDLRSLLDLRVLRTAGIFLVLCSAAYPFVNGFQNRLWILAVLLTVNGIFLYVPPYMAGANKDSRSLSSLDAALLGLGAGAGVLPGISRMGVCTSVGLMRGMQRNYVLDMSLLLSIPALIVLMILDAVGILGALGTLTFIGFLKSLLAGVMSFGGAYFGIFAMRFMAVRAGFGGFAYYNWGMALFSLILYLMI